MRSSLPASPRRPRAILRRRPRAHRCRWAVFEREGRCEVVELSFSRLPSEQKWRWTGLGVTPSHYTLNYGSNQQIRARLLQHGYEILPANVERNGRWQ